MIIFCQYSLKRTLIYKAVIFTKISNECINENVLDTDIIFNKFFRYELTDILGA